MKRRRRIEDWLAIVFSVLAVMLGAACAILAATLPISTTTVHGTYVASSDVRSPPKQVGSTKVIVTKTTLIGHSGLGGYLFVSIPAIIAAAVSLLLHRARTTASRDLLVAAWVMVGILGLICLLGALTVGKFLLPIEVTLIVAAGASQRVLDRALAAPRGF